MNINSPSLIVNKLVVVGQRKNYVVPFHRGLNVIYGDSDTGKSSILNLIDYCLGSSEVDMYDELEYSGKYCLLEISLNNEIYTIKRDIFKPKDNIEVYHSEVDNMSKVFPHEYGPSYQKEGPAGFFCDFLLEALNIPLVKIKQAPSKEDSPVTRLSFRDIFKFCYIDQDNVGSKYILDLKNGAVFTKNKEVFKFLHNVLDSQITELEEDISFKVKQRNELERKYETVLSFLRETQIKPLEMINKEIQEAHVQVGYIEKEIHNLNNKMLADTDYLNELRNIVNSLEEETKQVDDERRTTEKVLAQNLSLKKDYEKDIVKLQSSIGIKNNLPNTNNDIACPICHSPMCINSLKEFFGENSSESLKLEINALNRRKKNLGELIDKQRNDMDLLEGKEILLRKRLDQARQLLDDKSIQKISPYISQRDGLISERARIEEHNNRLEYLLKIRNQTDSISKSIDSLVKQVDERKEKLEILKQNAPSTQVVINDIGDFLKAFLDYVNIKNASNIYINGKSFLPVVRNRDYTKLTSGGLRTLTSIGYYISLLQNSLSTSTNLPTFLMIDTIGKYIGKTKPEYLAQTSKTEDKKEGINDPQKYLNMYQYLIKLCSDTDACRHQIIVVDNEIPLEIESIVSKYVVKRFSAEVKAGFEIGFINDYN